MATAVQKVMSDLDLGIEREIEKQRDLIRRGEITRDNGQGGWTVLGPLITLRYERTAEHPDHSNTHLRPDLLGNCVDWGNAKNGPLVGITRDRSQVLIVTRCKPLPEIPDPSSSLDQFVVWDGNRIPLACVPPDMRADLKNQDGTAVKGADKAIHKPRMMKQRYADHAAGTMGQFLVIRPICEGLVKLAGITALQRIIFQSIARDYPGFYLDPLTGEAFLIGGKMELVSPRRGLPEE